MAEDRTGAIFDRRFSRHLLRLCRIYWTSPDARWGAVLLAITIALELGTVWGNLLVADAERRILDALAQREGQAFAAAITFFLGTSLAFVLVSAHRIFVRQALEIRWRRAVTAHYVDRWVDARAYLLPELHRGEVDNPDQRIQEDVRDFVASALGLSLSLLAAAATLASFGLVLWRLSVGWPLRLDGEQLRVPGLMLWLAIAYGLISMWATHLVGRRLVPINVDRLRFEADFRYGLMRFRDNAQAVALSRGEQAERREARTRFGRIARNWWQLIQAQRRLALVTGGIGQANAVVPVLVAVPAYFAGAITLGAIAQVRIAYGQVSGALAWFVFAYQEIARWRANVERLATLSEAMHDTREGPGGIEVVTGGGPALRLVDLRLDTPDGRVVLDGASATVQAGDRLVITGRSGTGKTLLFRAIAGIWPFGAGRIELPAHERMLFVGQWPYIPRGTMRTAASYPSPEGTFPDDRIAEALELLGLARLAALGTSEPWDQVLSPSEQQRLALVRVLLHEPDWLFLDKATSALDEDMEKHVYEVLAERLPHATVVTIAHRPGADAYHRRRWTLTPGASAVTLEAA